jgi:vitamin B12 transporter
LTRGVGLGAIAAVAALAPGAHAADSDEPTEVIVQGDRPLSRTGGRDRTAASSVLRQDDLRSPGETTADVLLELPSVQVARTGAASELATAAVRGTTSAQTPVYLAGIRLNDDVTGTADLSTVPLFMLRRIEVYRGNAPLDADRLGMGGAIFLDPILPRSSRLEAGIGVGSYRELSTWGHAAIGGEGGSALFAVRRDTSKNDYPFLDDRGTRFDPSDDRVSSRSNADSTSYDVWAVGRAELARDAEVLALSNVFLREQGVTGMFLYPATRARLRTARVLGAFSATSRCRGGERGSGDADEDVCRVEIITSGLSGRSRLDNPRQEVGPERLVESDGARVSQEERIQLSVGPRVVAGVALSQEAERLAVDLDGAPSARARRLGLTAAGTVLVHLTRAIDVLALGALDCEATATSAHASSCDVLEPVGRIGGRIEAGRDLQVYANVGRYVRVPTLGELYGTSAALRGNSALAPETGVSVDLGVRWEARSEVVSARAYLDSFVFSRFAPRLIAYRRSSFGSVTPYNVGNARVLGAELAAGVEALRAVRTELSLTTLDPRDVTEGRTLVNAVLPFRARLVASPRVELFAEPAWKALSLDRISLGARLTYRSSEYADPAGLEVIPGSTLVDVELGAWFWSKRVATKLRLANVFDERAFDLVGYSLPPRSLHASLEVAW